MAIEKSTWTTKAGLAQMLKGGVIMDVIDEEQAKIAEEAGAVAVMALERVPADIRRQGGVARMSDPELIIRIKESVTIPVMAKARIGHFVEAQVLEALGIDYIDESEVLTPADDEFHTDKHKFKIPFVNGCKNLGEALRRITEGAAMLRTKGEAGPATSSKPSAMHARCSAKSASSMVCPKTNSSRLPRICRHHMTWSSPSPRPVACPWSTSLRVVSQPQPTLH